MSLISTPFFISFFFFSSCLGAWMTIKLKLLSCFLSFVSVWNCFISFLRLGVAAFSFEIFSSFLSFSHKYLFLRFFLAFFFSFSISFWSRDLAAFRVRRSLFPRIQTFLLRSSCLHLVVRSRFEEGLFLFCITNQNFCVHSKRIHLFHSKMNFLSRIFTNTSVRPECLDKTNFFVSLFVSYFFLWSIFKYELFPIVGEMRSMAPSLICEVRESLV
ncbi:unnamed protein product [Acanthosepion pharaonis]|uniref:Uncharacterized protein n=1 Tax=Acanthosepion pharaonis TaxID=158019 RepID=A0A812AZ89_ACAPH|nr:unnamed protein product [Sepia pharaonis]